MRLWIALGIAIVLGTYVYMNQPQEQPMRQVVEKSPDRGPSPPAPTLAQTPRPIFHKKMKSVQSNENAVHEENFVEAVEEETPEKEAPDTLRYKKVQEESTPLMQLTNFEQNKNPNQMITLTYGSESDPKSTIKIENREVRRRRAFVAAEGDQ